MRILVTNDDSIHAEGIAVLEEIARSLSDDVWVVAPEHEQSGAGHSLTLHDPLRIRKADERHYAVSGTPTDSVLLGVKEIMQGQRPDLILSGINRGCNVAEDVTYSGTIAAAMEGTLLGIQSIALSQYLRDGEPVWEVGANYAADIIKQLLKIGWPDHNLININFPAVAVEEVKGIRLCPMGERKIGEKLDKRQDPKGRDYYWIGGPGTTPSSKPGADDVLLDKGYITITPICMDMTNYRLLEEIREHFEN